MNPLDKIKEGIEKQDWGLVCEGYNTMTGHNLLVSTQLTNKNVLMLESTIQLFKKCMKQMIDEFDFTQTINDKPDTEDYVVETCNQSSNDIDDEENVDFDEVTSAGDGVGLYGNKTVLITEKPKHSQIKANKKIVEDRGEPNIPRPPPKIHKVECTDCRKTFETRMKAGGQFGQKCPKCLRSMSRER